VSETKFNFKIGDKVRLSPRGIALHKEGDGIPQPGQIMTVTKLKGYIYVKWEKDRPDWLFTEDEIELIPMEDKFKPGDTVSVKPETIKYLSGKNLTLLNKQRIDDRDIWKATDGRTEYLLFENQIMPMEKKEMFKPYIHTHTTTKTVKDIYGTSTPSIPEGWKAIEFRLVRRGDNYLNSIDQTHVVTATFNETEPRIILRKLEPISDKELLDCLMGWLWSNAPGYLMDNFFAYPRIFDNREEFDKAVLSRATELARKKKAKG